MSFTQPTRRQPWKAGSEPVAGCDPFGAGLVRTRPDKSSPPVCRGIRRGSLGPAEAVGEA